MAVDCVLICVETKRAIYLGVWGNDVSTDPSTAEFHHALLWHDDGSRLSNDEVRRVIAAFVAQSDGRTLRLIGENEYEMLRDQDPAWDYIERASAILTETARPPREGWKMN